MSTALFAFLCLGTRPEREDRRERRSEVRMDGLMAKVDQRIK